MIMFKRQFLEDFIYTVRNAENNLSIEAKLSNISVGNKL